MCIEIAMIVEIPSKMMLKFWNDWRTSQHELVGKNFKAYLENLLKIPNCADSGLPKQDQT